MAAHPSSSVHTALADVFLTSIPSPERNFAVRNLAANVDSNTLGLVAALVHQYPDSEANAYLNAFLIRSIENQDAASAAALCVHYPRIRNALLQKAERELNVCFLQLLRREKNEGFVVPVAKVLTIETSEHYDPQDGIDHQTQDLVNACVLYLNFAKHLFRCKITDGSFIISSPIVCAIFGLLASSSPEIAPAAKETAFAFLAAFKSGAFTFSHHKSDPDELDRHLWRCIQNLLKFAQKSSYKTTAYAIWLRWLDLPSYGHSRQYAIQKDDYWKYLLTTLGQVSQGDTEQRKSCLHILRRSIAVARNNIRANDMDLTLDEENRPGSQLAQVQYGRFCTVYETIVIGRYLNQALECVKDLDAFASDETTVQKSWLFALLESALSPVTQDSMRKMLGNWLMSTDINLSNHAEEFAHLLQNSFLPWATQGPLFTGSVQGKTRNMQSAHGNRVASFFERLLQSHTGQDETYSRKCIVNAVLKFLDDNKNRLVPCSVLFLLQGVLRGMQSKSTPCMEGEELELILNLSRTTGFPEIARDALSLQCHELAKFVGDEQEPSGDDAVAVDTKLEALSSKIGNLKLNPSSSLEANPSNSSSWKTLDQFLTELQDTRYDCVKGTGLRMACESLTAILDETDSSDLNTKQLHEALDAVWDELERQDYPKDIILFLPGLVLHPVSVARCLDDEPLSELVLDLFRQLRTFVKGRIYLWAPLMKAFRTALLSCPSAAERLSLDDFIIEAANSPPAAKVEFKLEAAAIQLLTKDGEIARAYSDYYGEYEEIGYAAFFDLLNRFNHIDSSMASNVYQRLLEPWTAQKPPVPIVTKWKTTVQLQTLLILSEQRLDTMTLEQAQEQIHALLRVVAIEPLPRFRFLLEWMISRIVVRHQATGENVLEALSTMDHHANPKYLACLIKIAVMLACLDDCPSDFAARVATRLVALSSSSKIIIRHEAQWSFPILWDHAEKRGWTEITSSPACAALNEYIRSLERYSEPPAARELERLDPVSEHSLANLLQGIYLRLEPQGEETVTAEDFQELWNQDRSNRHLSDTLPPGYIPLGVTPEASVQINGGNWYTHTQSNQQETKASARTEAFAALQTKGTAYLAAEAPNSISNTETGQENEHQSNNNDEKPNDLIVVASLVDNAYNLGGLSRISEIFGAKALYISNPTSVLSNKDFISVAVASQNHIPIHDLRVQNLVAFLTSKKTEGYSVVGVEQTDRSVILGAETTVLPDRVCLVMGAEKEGIPALVLGECDVLVEVPQRGVTRSMNVQTAAGVVLYEYERQQRGRRN